MKKVIILGGAILLLASLVWADTQMSIGGLIEVGYEKIGDEVGNIEAGDIELNVKARLNEKVSGEIVLRIDKLPEAGALDKAIITLEKFSQAPFSVTVGKTVMPFGVFDSHLISDPWTKENDLVVWETEAVGLIGGYAYKLVEVTCALYDSSDLANPGAFAAQSFLMVPDGATLGASYNAYHKDVDNESLEYSDFSIMAKLVVGRMTVNGEYSGATKRKKDAPKPTACSIGLAFQATVPLELAARYDSLNDDDEDSISVESRTGGGFNYTLFEAVTLSAEYGHTREEKGEGKDEFLAKLAIEF